MDATNTKSIIELLRDLNDCLAPGDYYCPCDQEHVDALESAIKLIESFLPIPVSDMTKCVWTNASGDYSAANPENWEGGRMPQTVDEWPDTYSAKDMVNAYETGCRVTRQWPLPIPVSERLPDPSDWPPGVSGIPRYYLVLKGGEDWDMAEYTSSGWKIIRSYRVPAENFAITHWLPLPPPVKE